LAALTVFADPQGRFGDRDRFSSIYVVETASATMKCPELEHPFIAREAQKQANVYHADATWPKDRI
jgi:hypothetical protein